MEQPPAPKSKLKKLSEDSLTKQPEEVFDVLEKLGEGSYGSVFKAIHKESGQVVAIKQVPVESDLQEIIKEISIMQQCDRSLGFINLTVCAIDEFLTLTCIACLWPYFHDNYTNNQGLQSLIEVILLTFVELRQSN